MADLSLPTASLLGLDSFLRNEEPSFATIGSAPPPVAAAAPYDAAHDLRTRLVARGWVNPRALLDPPLSDESVTATLNAAAEEAETAFATKPGAWFLSVAARRPVIASRGIAALKAELETVRLPEDITDPVRLALRFAVRSDPLPPLDKVDTEVLRSLSTALDWFDGAPPVQTDRPSLPSEISAALAARVQARDLARLTERAMVGKGHLAALGSLSDWLERISRGLTVQYLYGSGGAGKSTLLAFLESKVGGPPPAPIFVRIDFDNPLVNAADPMSLDIALVGQLEQRYPGLVPGAGGRIDQLRRLQRDQKADVLIVSGLRRRRIKREAQVESLSLESIHSSSKSERVSVLYDALRFDRPLALVLDTAELVVTQGETAMVELTGWIRSLTEGLGAADVRLVIAGRDPPGPPGCGDLIDRLRDIASMREPIELHDLNVAEATQLLLECNVDDPDVARAAAKAVPGNPLLLRITADALQSAELADEVRAAHNDNRVDASSASTYLARRIVAHLADPAGRPYLLAATHLPLVYRAVLRDVLIPLVDATPGQSADRRTTDRVFDALRGAQWLTRVAADRRALSFQRDVRALVLKLLASDPEQRKLAERIHRRALDFHSRRRGARDRAFAVYHRAMLGEPPGRPRNAVGIVAQLGTIIEDLTPDWQAALRAPTGARSEVRTIKARGPLLVGSDTPSSGWRSDEDWRLYLEGAGAKGGEGDRLLDRDRAEEALKLYRDRPTQPRETPPTFVVRALADMGEWNSDDIDVAAVAAGSREWDNDKRLGAAALSRLYWITRLMLLRDNARLPEEHIETLRRACALLTGEGLTTMPALMAVAEAGSKVEIMPERMISSKGASQTVMRVSLARAAIRRRPFAVTLPTEDIIVIQRDWHLSLVASGRGMTQVARLEWVQRTLSSLDHRPIAEFNATLRDSKQAIDLKWDGRDLTPAILALRGQTTEFLRPLRQVLVELHANDPDALLHRVLKPVVDRMSLRPVEFSADRLVTALTQDARAWCAALVGFVDRARLLPLLCRLLIDLPDTAPAAGRTQHVARSFLAWDEALCGGGTSGWPPQ